MYIFVVLNNFKLKYNYMNKLYEEYPIVIEQHGRPEFIVTGLVIGISMKVSYRYIQLSI